MTDNGPGAPADIAEHLFDPFVSGEPEGQGLRPALVDKLMRDMGGIVQYAREGLPTMTALRLLPATGRHVSRILVVDDDAAIRTVVAQALRRAGHRRPDGGNPVRRPIVRWRSRLPDVLITDVVLPDGDGIDHGRGRTPATPTCRSSSCRRATR